MNSLEIFVCVPILGQPFRYLKFTMQRDSPLVNRETYAFVYRNACFHPEVSATTWYLRERIWVAESPFERLRILWDPPTTWQTWSEIDNCKQLGPIQKGTVKADIINSLFSNAVVVCFFRTKSTFCILLLSGALPAPPLPSNNRNLPPQWPHIVQRLQRDCQCT